MTSAPANGNRTHEPSLRELTAELEGLRELLIAKIEATNKTMDERDKLYTERDKASSTALNAALQAAQTLNSTIFASSEKAIEKADTNAEKWRQNANEWRAAMQDREQKFATKPEVESELKSINATLVSLRETRSEGAGGKALVMLSVAIVGGVSGLIGLAVVAAKFMGH